MLKLHLAVLLFGFAGLFGKLLTIPPPVIVWGRTFFAVISLVVFLGLGNRRRIRPSSPRDYALLVFQGFLLAGHWLTFFHSIQVSSVAVGLLSFSTFPIFVLFLEAWLFKGRLTAQDLISAALVFLGLALIVRSFQPGETTFIGAVWGTVSGLTFALLTLFNRKLSSSASPAAVALAQNLVAALVLTPFSLSELGLLPLTDWVLLAALGIFCTALAHSLFIASLTQVRAFIASLVACLEPVYGIVAAVFVLGEIPSLRQMAGGLIIVVMTGWTSLAHGRNQG
ncbi:MAG: DMT family transporter [Thermodesulfobacteriota bacterium]